MQARRIAVIGIGNPLRGDDGVGALLAEQAGGRSVQQLTPELASELASLDAVLFIDAWQAPPEAQPQLLPLTPAGVARGTNAPADSHRLDPAALVAACQLLYGRAPEAQMLLVPAHGFMHGTLLSAELQAVMPAAHALLRQWLAGHA